MVHVVDADDELMWTDDHDPPMPTTQWKPGQTIEYTRTMFVPVYPYVGEASVQIGLYSTTTQKRLPLDGEDVGQRAYRVARFQLQPQTENVFTVFKDGWHPAEVADTTLASSGSGRRRQATMAFKNPKKDSTFYLDVDNPGGVFNEPQQVKVTHRRAGRRPIHRDAEAAGPAQDSHEGRSDGHRRDGRAADRRGQDLRARADRGTGSKDPRELGIRVFHAFVQPNN